MGMSHATGIWICKPGARTATVLAALREQSPGLFEHGAELQAARRRAPGVLAVTAFLDGAPDLEMDFELLDPAALALARRLEARVYRLYHFTGSGDFLWVEAFDASGRRWGVSVGDDGKLEREAKAAKREVQRCFGAETFEAMSMGTSLPYWRMWSELSDRPQRVIELHGSPPLDFLEGWKPVPLGVVQEERPPAVLPPVVSRPTSYAALAEMLTRGGRQPFAKRDDVQALLAFAKAKGAPLTDDELYDRLPPGLLDDHPAHFDELLELFGANGVVLES